jgi:hypothetical protein
LRIDGVVHGFGAGSTFRATNGDIVYVRAVVDDGLLRVHRGINADSVLPGVYMQEGEFESVVLLCTEDCEMAVAEIACLVVWVPPALVGLMPAGTETYVLPAAWCSDRAALRPVEYSLRGRPVSLLLAIPPQVSRGGHGKCAAAVEALLTLIRKKGDRMLVTRMIESRADLES